MSKLPSPSLTFFFMAILAIFFIFLATLCASEVGGGVGGEVGSWCVAKNNAEDAALEAALKWACGEGTVNCTAIQPGGQCYDPHDILQTASFAFNDYFRKHAHTSQSCDFGDTAQITSLDPSRGSCKMPSSPSASKGNISGTVDGRTGRTGLSSADSSDGNSVLRRAWLTVVLIPLFFTRPMISS